jgi:hypothetical protein
MSWWVLWGAGMVVALAAIVLPVANFGIWEILSSKRVATSTGIGAASALIFILLAISGRSLGWSGFCRKKLWDWVELLGPLAIPVVIASAGFWFTAQQAEHQRVIENHRSKSERRVGKQRADDATLQTT